jgi:hypothetical protein
MEEPNSSLAEALELIRFQQSMLEKQADEIRRLRLAIALLNYKPQPKKRGRPVKGPDPLVVAYANLLAFDLENQPGRTIKETLRQIMLERAKKLGFRGSRADQALESRLRAIRRYWAKSGQ